MALKGRMSRTILVANFLALDISLLLYLGFPTLTGTVAARRPIHASSAKITYLIPASKLDHVSIGDSLVFPIVQQPSGEPNYVSKNNGEVTQFSAAAQYGNIGLLAHNYLSGKDFSRFVLGEKVSLEYDEGNVEKFVITEILRYQALEPENPYGNFRNLDNPQEVLSATEMFERAYAGKYHVTFQTCIKAHGDASWGRLFILAMPEVH